MDHQVATTDNPEGGDSNNNIKPIFLFIHNVQTNVWKLRIAQRQPPPKLTLI